MFNSTPVLWACIPLLIALSVMGTDRTPIDLSASLALPLILGLWVIADAHKRRRPLCYDYGSFVFFAWPVVIPIYLFQTRGWRAFATLLCFAGLIAIGAGLGHFLGAEQ